MRCELQTGRLVRCACWPASSKPLSSGSRPTRSRAFDRRDGRSARHDPPRDHPAAGPHVPLCRAGARTRGRRRGRTKSSRWSMSLSMIASVEPLEELETRELHSYLRDAISLLPERHRFVVVGYFLENKTSQDLARFLGVTESRVSQLRSEALMMMKEGIEAQYWASERRRAAVGRVARRKAQLCPGNLGCVGLDRSHRSRAVDRVRGPRRACAAPAALTARRDHRSASHSAPRQALSRAITQRVILTNVRISRLFPPLLGVALIVAGCSSGDSAPAASQSPSSSAPANSFAAAPEGVTGVLAVPVDGAEHVRGKVDYPTAPPAGGDHNTAWQNCGFYSSSVTNENAVHSLEHGAVWITYRADIDSKTRDTLVQLARTSTHLLITRFDANPTPVVLTAWARQLRLDSYDADRVASFIERLRPDRPHGAGEGRVLFGWSRYAKLSLIGGGGAPRGTASDR